MNARRAVAAAAVTVTVVAFGVTAVDSAAAAAGHTELANSKPSWVSHARELGGAKSSARVNARVYLQPRGGLTHLESVATAISTPGSATYRHFLTSSQYAARYSPTAASVAKVTKFLRSAGLTVTTVGPQRDYVAFTGTVSSAQKAFHTRIARFRHLGHVVDAPSRSLAVPASLASTVLTVTGLDATPQTMKPGIVTPAAAPPNGFRNARPCSTFFGQLDAEYKADYATPLPQFNGLTLPYAPCGYTGPQLRAAYEGNTNLDGSGVTVAVVDAYAAPSLPYDTNHYATLNGDGSYASGQLTQSTPASYNHQGLCGPSGWYGEETLDVEAVHAMAPGANIHYYGASSCLDDDFRDALAQVVIDDTAQLVTDSWGSPGEADDTDSIAAYEAVFLQGAVEGISFMFSSGDNGDELANTGLVQTDYPTSDPYVTSVGGTSTAIGPNGNLEWQTGWGTVKYSLASNGSSWVTPTFLYGAGGGSSSEFGKPAYQEGINASPYRQVPDVAMDADPNTGMLIGETQTFSEGRHYDQCRIGGTSLASPLFAGMTALTLENAGSAAGLLNPSIYSNPNAFTDVKAAPASHAGDVRVDYVNGVDGSSGLAYSVRTFGQDSSLFAHGGWDDVTGVGSASPAWLSALGTGGP